MAGKTNYNPKSLQNLRPSPETMTHEQYVEAGRKGGLKRAANIRQRESFRQIIERLGQRKLSKRQKADLAERLGVDIAYIEDVSLDVAAVYAQYIRALGGDTESARFLRDTVGEAPSLAVSVGALDPATADMASLSDAQIAAQIAELEGDLGTFDGSFDGNGVD